MQNQHHSNAAEMLHESRAFKHVFASHAVDEMDVVLPRNNSRELFFDADKNAVQGDKELSGFMNLFIVGMLNVFDVIDQPVACSTLEILPCSLHIMARHNLRGYIDIVFRNAAFLGN